MAYVEAERALGEVLAEALAGGVFLHSEVGVADDCFVTACPTLYIQTVCMYYQHYKEQH